MDKRETKRMSVTTTTLAEGAGTSAETFAEHEPGKQVVETPVTPVKQTPQPAGTEKKSKTVKQDGKALRWYEGYRAGYFC